VASKYILILDNFAKTTSIYLIFLFYIFLSFFISPFKAAAPLTPALSAAAAPALSTVAAPDLSAATAPCSERRRRPLLYTLPLVLL
jgi:hypothetical protein